MNDRDAMDCKRGKGKGRIRIAVAVGPELTAAIGKGARLGRMRRSNFLMEALEAKIARRNKDLSLRILPAETPNLRDVGAAGTPGIIPPITGRAAPRVPVLRKGEDDQNVLD